MALSTAKVESMLRASFVKAELEFLNSNPHFLEALPLVTTEDQYKKLCDLCDELLAAHGRANRSAQQFRQDARRSC